MYRKIVITKQIIEVMEYEKLNVNSKGGFKEKKGFDQEENYIQTQRKRRNMIRQLVCSNFDSGSKFVTLTFDNARDFDIKDPKECNKAFKQFVQRLKYKCPELRYVAVIEFQDENKRGAVHYHMICNLPYIKKSELAGIWQNGFVKINAIDKVDNIGAYVVKYMTADTDDGRLKGLKAYNCSKGLVKPVELKSWDLGDVESVKQVDEKLKNKTPSYGGTYESEFAGKVNYYQFNFNRKASI